VFLKWQDLYLLCTNNLTPQKRVGEVFCSEIFSQGYEAKLNRRELKDGQNHKLGDTSASLNINKNLGMQIFKLLFFEHYESLVKLGRLVFTFGFRVASLSFVDHLQLWIYYTILYL
jgi:hypothetical protein